MAYFKLLAGKHHTGWQRKLSELTLKQLRVELDKAEVDYPETAKRARLEELLQEEVGDLVDNRHTYSKGDIIKTDQDLCKLNDPGNPANNKFEQVNEYGQAIGNIEDAPPAKSAPSLGLDDMTVHQLRKVAATEEIDIDGLTKKDDIIAALRPALV